MLHLIFQAPIETAILERIYTGDVVVFLDNAVLCALQNGAMSSSLTKQLDSNRLCVLTTDLAVRGIAHAELVTGFEVIDYAGLVELTVNNPIIQSWT